ncbi:hypothetical protein QYE76_067133 [Lolium multiflorum]|uniref:Gag-pol polyprotein n=1 Tax=Lolium multiflorum TaxID=4521 RepID=A0AAD8SCY3_LOLMU|nr:hypothetical protein QYE76_067133 [Lolium multiflorum]
MSEGHREAELIGSSETTRSRNIKLKGNTCLSHGVNTVDLSHSIREPGFSFSVNMARLVNCHSADKAESSHSRGKDKEEAVPRDRPQDDDRRYLTEEEVRSIRYQRPLSVHLLNKYEQQYDRRRRYDEDDEKYRRSDAENRRYRQYDGSNDGYERHAGGRSREQDDIDRHWGCPFFKHCWDSGMSRLPTIENCPECKQQRKRTSEVSVFERLGPLSPQNKRAESSQEEDFEESDGEEDRYHRPRWCPDGLSHSRSVGCNGCETWKKPRHVLYTLRRARPDLAVKIQQTLETKARPPKKVWRPKQADAEISAAADHKILSFMDGNAGYNQIFMAPEDIHKTAFRVPGSVGLFEYVVMTFGLKNAGATYQRAMNYIFHDLIGKLVEIYIDDVVVKSVATDGHLEDLRRVLDRTRKFGLRMNPKKCAFGVTAGQFLGFLVHERGIEIGLKSQEAVRTMKPPTTKKELQCLIGKINFVRRFISNLSGRIEPFMGLVKIKPDEEFRWGAEQQQAFDDIKEYLTKPPVLVPPRQDRPFYIYLSVADTSIASVVVQVYDGLEKVVFYLSRRMLDAETRYPEIEKLCLCLFFTCTKIQHILVSADIIVICKSDVIKHMLSAPVLKGRLGKWMFALSEFEIRYQPAKAVKGQALADLIAERINTDVAALSVRAWAMFFDGSVCEDGCGIGVLLVSPRGQHTPSLSS